MALKPKTVEVKYLEVQSLGSLVMFDCNPSKIWPLMIGACVTKHTKTLFFPAKYRLEDIVLQIESWPTKTDTFLLYDNIYRVSAYSMKYEMNDHPHNWNRLRGQKKIDAKNGLLFEIRKSLVERRNSKNVRRLKRPLLKKLNRDP